MIQALKNFDDNLKMLLKFYSEFVNHFNAMERWLIASKSSVKLIDFIMYAFNFYPKDIKKEDLEQRLAMLGISNDELNQSLRISKQDPQLLEMNLGDIFKTIFMESLSSHFKKKNKQKNEKLTYDDVIPIWLKEFSVKQQKLRQNELILLDSLLSQILIQIWMIFETYLKDITYYLIKLNSKEFESDVTLYLQQTKKTISVKTIMNDAPSYFGRWYNLKELIEKVWNLSFFPNMNFQAKFGIEKQIQGNLSLYELLQIIMILRNALVHYKGIIRQEDVLKSKFFKIMPQKVLLDKEYIKYLFVFIYKLVYNLNSQIKSKFKN